MANTAGAPQIDTMERVLLKVDEGVFGALYRFGIGVATLPTMSLLFGSDHSDWILVPFLLFILLLLRIVPAVIRKLVPFSRAAQDVWAERRRMAKHYDSYQWRKLLWIGVGLAFYLAISGEATVTRIAVCSACLLGGAAGWVMWRSVSAKLLPENVQNIA